MNDQPLPRRIAWFAPWTWKRRRLWVTMFTLLLIVGYPLSYGPVSAIVFNHAGWIPWSVYITVYHPLFWLQGESQIIDDWFDWYESLFMNL